MITMKEIIFLFSIKRSQALNVGSIERSTYGESLLGCSTSQTQFEVVLEDSYFKLSNNEVMGEPQQASRTSRY